MDVQSPEGIANRIVCSLDPTNTRSNSCTEVTVPDVKNYVAWIKDEINRMLDVGISSEYRRVSGCLQL